ncbi:MAG: helix-turn-helix transcriptional regulator [Lachnospiraceae bacterium]|nr:helix-turn-helix transcriptional regulator [Lachnospiraceae bacterium]
MIENLNGTQETVTFKPNTHLTLYDNCKTEDYVLHWHIPLEIIMPLTNAYTVYCNDKTFVLQEGHILIINSGTLHHMPAQPGRRIIFQADFSLLRNLRELNASLALISYAKVFTPENSPAIHTELQQILLEIREEYGSDSLFSEAAVYAKLINMFVLIGRNHTLNSEIFDVQSRTQKEYVEKFMYICQYIDSHCTEELSIEEAAALIGFSKYHFSRLFKQFTNTSFYKYLSQKRISYAENLLTTSNITVTDVAASSGFPSVSAFIRMFKIIKGCTPTEFRSMYES